eukprot:5002229-Prymnesium_polylepis.1
MCTFIRPISALTAFAPRRGRRAQLPAVDAPAIAIGGPRDLYQLRRERARRVGLGDAIAVHACGEVNLAHVVVAVSLWRIVHVPHEALERVELEPVGVDGDGEAAEWCRATARLGELVQAQALAHVVTMQPFERRPPRAVARSHEERLPAALHRPRDVARVARVRCHQEDVALCRREAIVLVLRDQHVLPMRPALAEEALERVQQEGRLEHGVRPRAQDDGVAGRSDAEASAAPLGDRPTEVPHRIERVRKVRIFPRAPDHRVREPTAKGRRARQVERPLHVVDAASEGPPVDVCASGVLEVLRMCAAHGPARAALERL